MFPSTETNLLLEWKTLNTQCSLDGLSAGPYFEFCLMFMYFYLFFGCTACGISVP